MNFPTLNGLIPVQANALGCKGAGPHTNDLRAGSSDG